MIKRQWFVGAGLVLGALLWSVPASAQQVTPCSTVEVSPNLPPAGSPALVRCIEQQFHPTETNSVDSDTYGYYIKPFEASLRSQNKWVPYNEEQALAAFSRLMHTSFLGDAWVEVIDEPYENGVPGKHVIFHMEERQRLKAVDYTGSKKVEISKIEEALKDRGIKISFDTFVDESVIRKVKGVIKELYAAKGYQYATVDVQKTVLPNGPKLLRLDFNITEGPEVKISEIFFDGNKAVPDKVLAKQMKDNKARGFLSFITGRGQFQETKFEEDAQRVTDYYGNNGYARARVGSPQLETIKDSKDGKTRFVRLRIPVDEGERYKVGKIEVAGNTSIRTEYLRPLFKMQEGDEYNRKKIEKGYEKAKEAYGAGGFMEFTMLPDLQFRGLDPETGKPIGPDPPPNIVDLVMRIDEGKQFFVNRITIKGNTNTHDTVVRRDMRLYEGGIFNTEALKESVRRINQLGYFKPVEKGDAIQVDKTPGVDGKVDITLKVEEQNRNSLSFGAGISQFEGFFGQLSFQTANFLGRGETVGVSLQKGVQASNYQVSFSEPYLFDRPISAGFDVFSRQYIYPNAYTQNTTGTNTILGLPLRDYTRAFLGYSYEIVQVTDINPIYNNPAVIQQSPYLADSLLLNQEGNHRKVSKISPSVVFNTINQPIFPSQGRRYSIATDLAGFGGNTDYFSVNAEGIWYIPFTPRMSLGIRGKMEYIRPYGRTETLPIFEKFFMGGEYSVRGFDIRSIGPRDPVTGVLTGGNKTLLLNAEYSINVGGPVRTLAFFDAGQVQDIGQPFRQWEPIKQVVGPPPPLLLDPFAPTQIVVPGSISVVTTGKASAFKTSMGGEVRFFMPVLNVPFRLIAAYNPQRYGVINNNGALQKKFTFRFAVGTTF